MDSLSHLLSFCQGEAHTDLRCQLRGQFNVPNKALERGEAAFHIMLKGSCTLTLAADESYRLNPGDFALLPHGDAHQIRSHPAQSFSSDNACIPWDVSRYTLLPIKRIISSGTTEEVDLLCGRLIYSQSPGWLIMQSLPHILIASFHNGLADNALSTLTQLIRAEALHPQAASLSIINTLSHTLFAYALRQYSEIKPLEASWLSLVSHPRLNASLQAMLNDPGHPWSLEKLGTVAAMSRATYARQFKQISGMTYGDVLTRIRIINACQLMQQQRSTKLADIAQQVGYQSEAAFGKAFKKKLGETPGKWRQKI